MVHWLGTCVVAVALVSAGCGGSGTLPAPGPIAYTAWPQQITEIDTMKPDGTHQRRIPRTGASDAPSWSPDGSMIAFSFVPIDCFEIPACAQICIVNVDGTDRRCITPREARSEGPAWSPSGEEIAFVRWNYSGSDETAIETDIYAVRVDGTAERWLSVAAGEDSDPDWSPDGKKIAFSSDRDDPERSDFDLYVMDADGSDVEVLNASPAADYWPKWSPDGDEILFTRIGRGDDRFDVWLMNSDGSAQRTFTQTVLAESQATWSPDGSRIALVCEVEATGSDEICLMNADGTGRRVVTHYAAGIDGTSGPDWGPLVK